MPTCIHITHSISDNSPEWSATQLFCTIFFEYQYTGFTQLFPLKLACLSTVTPKLHRVPGRPTGVAAASVCYQATSSSSKHWNHIQSWIQLCSWYEQHGTRNCRLNACKSLQSACTPRPTHEWNLLLAATHSQWNATSSIKLLRFYDTAVTTTVRLEHPRLSAALSYSTYIT